MKTTKKGNPRTMNQKKIEKEPLSERLSSVCFPLASCIISIMICRCCEFFKYGTKSGFFQPDPHHPVERAFIRNINWLLNLGPLKFDAEKDMTMIMEGMLFFCFLIIISKVMFLKFKQCYTPRNKEQSLEGVWASFGLLILLSIILDIILFHS